MLARSALPTIGREAALEFANRAIAIKADNQAVAFAPRLLQQPDMADVQDVEAAVGEDHALACGSPGGDPRTELVELQYLLLHVRADRFRTKRPAILLAESARCRLC